MMPAAVANLRQCEHCGYSLAGLAPGTCPECGQGMDFAKPFRQATAGDLARACLHMLWPTAIATIVPLLVLAAAGFVALLALWPPLLWGWLLAAIGQPIVVSRRYVDRHILVRHRLLVRRLLVTGAVAVNTLQTWLLLGILLGLASWAA